MERLLLYLQGKDVFVSDEGFIFAQPSITQEGIAKALGIGRNNVPRLLKPLIEEGYVREWKARVYGHSHRKKVYTRTPKGERKTKELSQKS